MAPRRKDSETVSARPRRAAAKGTAAETVAEETPKAPRRRKRAEPASAAVDEISVDAASDDEAAQQGDLRPSEEADETLEEAVAAEEAEVAKVVRGRQPTLDPRDQPREDDPQRADSARAWLDQHAGGDAQHIRHSIVLVTPEIASDMLALARRRGGEYRSNREAIKTYAESMLAGDWFLNGMAIAFSVSQNLLDGYQRLQACLEARAQNPDFAGFPTFLIQNLPDEAVDVTDRQRKRSFAQTVEHRGAIHATAQVAALAKLIRIQEGTLGLKAAGAAMPWSTLERFFWPNHNLLQRSAIEMLDRTWASNMLTDAVRVPLAYVAKRMGKDAELLALLKAFYDPERADDGAPGRRLWERVEGAHEDAERGRPNPHRILAFALMALDEQIAGKRKHRRYTWDAEERFPVPSGYPGLLPPTEALGQVRMLQDAEVMEQAEGITMSLERITPAQAVEWLSPKVNVGNRKIQPGSVATLTRDILGGFWSLSPHPICFSEGGRLLNGQHRLSALVEAGKTDPEVTIEVFVVRGLHDEAFTTYDMQRRRATSLTDIEGQEAGNEPLIIAIANTYWKHRVAPRLAEEWAKKHPDAAKRKGRALTRWQKPSDSELRMLIKQQPLIVEARKWGHALREFGRPATMAYAVIRMVEETSRERALQFVEQVATGAGITSKRSPILRLRERLSVMKEKGRSHEIAYDRNEAMADLLETYEREVLGHGKGKFVISDLVDFLTRREERERKEAEAKEARRLRRAQQPGLFGDAD